MSHSLNLPDISLNSQTFQKENERTNTQENLDLETTQLHSKKNKTKKNSGKKEQSTFAKACGCLTIEYWSEFFEIDQNELIQRIKAAINPSKPQLAEAIEEKPDLYGPFWVSSSLVFMLLISESLWDVLKNMLNNKDSRITFNFGQVGLAFTLVYGSFFAFPLIFIIINKLLGSSSSVIKCGCIYGYSMISLVAASTICVIPITGLRYIVWILALVHSVLSLFTNLKGHISQLQGNSKTGVVVLVAVFQLIIIVVILKNFYLDPIGTNPNITAVTPAIPKKII